MRTRTGEPPMVDKDEFTKALKLLSQKHIAFVPAYADLMGSLAGGILLSQLMYHWGNDPGSSFRKTDKQLREETRLSLREFREAKKRLKALPFVTVVPVGIPPVTQYAIDPEGLIVALACGADSAPTDPNDGDEIKLNEVVQFRSNDGVQYIKKEYKKEYKKEREEYIQSPLKKNSVGKEKTKPNVSDEAARLSLKLKESILSNYPNARPATESQLGQWALELDLLHRIDGKGWDEIEKLLAWSQHDPFWKQNIQSGGKFREKWNTLLARSSSRGDTFAPARPASATDILQRWMREEQSNGNEAGSDGVLDVTDDHVPGVAKGPGGREEVADASGVRAVSDRCLR